MSGIEHSRPADRKIDRRAARTRALLQQAHLSLILEKGYEAMTVEDICAAANVGRSTFYAHFAGKDDLKRSGFERLRIELLEQQRTALAANRRLGFGLALFEHARDHLDLYRALAGGRGGAVALGSIRQILVELMRNELADGSDATARDLAVQYAVGAYMAVLTWWLDGGARLPPGQIDAMVRRLALQGIAPA